MCIPYKLEYEITQNEWGEVALTDQHWLVGKSEMTWMEAPVVELTLPVQFIIIRKESRNGT